MMLHIVSGGLVAVATLFLGLAVLAVLSSRRTRQASTPPSKSHKVAKVVDLQEFARLITDDAPSLLQHLSHWWLGRSGEALQAIVDSYIATSGMNARNRVLSIYMELYGQPDDGRQLAAALASVLDKIDAITGESVDSVASLLREIGTTSPAQLRAWSLLRSLLEISEVKAIKLKRRLAAIASSESPSATKGIESEMAHLVTSLNTLSTELSSRLPAERVKKKDRRRASLEASVEFLERWVQTCPAFGTSEVAALPEGVITRQLAENLWVTLNDSLTKSGGAEREPNWPHLPPAIRTRSEAGARRRSSTVALASIAVVLYASAAWLLLRPGNFALDRALLNTVQIETPDGKGVGFFVRPGGWVVTNRHLVSDFKEVRVSAKRTGKSAQRRQVMSARVVSVGSADEDDVAILQISPADFPAEIPEGLPIEKGPGFRVGHEVYVLGNPLRLKDVYTRGVIMKVENGRALMDVEVAPGSSGGPVCDNRGVVVGIATAYAESGRTNLGLGVAIPTSSAWRLIDRISHGHAN